VGAHALREVEQLEFAAFRRRFVAAADAQVLGACLLGKLERGGLSVDPVGDDAWAAGAWVGEVGYLPDDAPLRDAVAALNAEAVPTTSPLITGQAMRLEAVLSARSGDGVGAACRWSSAIKLVARAGMVFDAAVLRLELFEHAPDDPGALAGWHEAVETFTDLRATPWLDRARLAAQGVAPS
jgi:hypothetical protein